MRKPKLGALVLMTVACVALPVLYVVRTSPSTNGTTGAASAESGPGAARLAPIEGDIAAKPVFLLRHTAMDASYGVLAAEYAPESGIARRATSMSCERVHMAAGRGVCLEFARRSFTKYTAVLFDASLQPTARVTLRGVPSRARVSPDGRYVATTAFVTGHSYSSGDFSTHTQIVDAVTGAPVIADLEELEVWSGTTRLEKKDFNFWGVTFHPDGKRFYATLKTGGVAHLVAGDLEKRRVSIVRGGIECPSLSPDATRIAFKKAVRSTGLPVWRPAVLDLQTMTETLLAETRNVDEQLDWLDSGHIMYTQPDETAASKAVTNVWAVPADGRGQPRLLLKQASAAALVRPAGKSATERIPQ